MKSLKRTLCLVLALVMVLGLFGIASATDFTDDNTIQYKEAVDVMTGIGAINGMGDGSFNPKGTITRAQAAKLVTYAVLGKTAADSLTGVTSSFTDVTVDGGYGWAIPSIEYLVKAGVINGMGDGTFNPNGEITGYAVGKMLLCALGYGAKGEYVGTQWDLNVAIDGGKAGVFADRVAGASALSAPATREEVALYCFNILLKPTVQYVSSLDIYVTDGSLGMELDTIAAAVYGYKPDGSGNLVCTTADTGVDAFGAPANVWSYDGKEIGKYAIPAAITYTTAKTVNDLKKELKGYSLHKTGNTIDADAYINGAKANLDGSNSNVFATIGTATANGTDLVEFIAANATATTGAKNSGNGTVVRIFADVNKVISRVVVVKTDLAKVAAVNPITKTATFTTVSAAPVSGTYTITEEAAPELYAKVAGLAEGDLVLVTPVDATVAKDGSSYAAAAVAIPTQMSGKLSSQATATGVVTIDGKGYGVSAATAVTADNIKLDAGTDAAVWLDSYGYIVNIKAADSTYDVIPSFAFVVDAYQSMPANKIIDMAKIVLPDGSVKDVPTGTAATPGTLYKVSKVDKDTGAYVLAPIVAKAAKDFANDGTVITTLSGAKGIAAAPAGVALELNTDKKIVATDTRLNKDVAGGTTNFYNNFYSGNVKFIYVTKTGTTSNYTYTVSDVKDGVQAVKTSDTEKAYAIVEPNDPKDITSTPVVTAVILVNGVPQTAADTSKVLYIPSTTTVSVDSMYNNVTKRYEDVNVYRVFENGVEKTMPISGGTVAKGFFNYKASTTYTGAYEIEEAYDVNNNTVVNKAVGKVIEGNDPNSIGNLVYLDRAGTPIDLDISKATIIDSRTDAQKAASGQMPVTESLSGVLTALKKCNLTVSVLYDVKTQAASIVYIESATTVATSTISDATITDNSTGATIATSTAAVNKYGSYKVTVTVGTPLTDAQDVTIALTTDATAKITYTTTTDGTMTAPALYSAKVVLAKGFTGTLEFTVSNVTAASVATAVTFS